MSDQYTGRVRVESEGDIVTVRRAIRDAAKEIGFGVTDLTRIVTAASELTRNIYLYAGSGGVRVRWRELNSGQSSGIKVVFEDRGPSLEVPPEVKVVACLDDQVSIIRGDPNQLMQVFRNIGQNGIQAMPDGGELMIRPRAPSADAVEVSISDTGMGIPEHQRERIFEPLFTTKTQGIGLGLAIVKTLVEGHDGRVTVESQVGEGTTFTVRLPVEACEGVRG